ncbi:MAG: PIG-L family deacetylase [Clostridia bacterium]|nr:PIG-L family deacetylase [Clostridia bacterium]
MASNIRKVGLWLGVLILSLLLLPQAVAENVATELTGEITFRGTDTNQLRRLTDGSVKKYYEGKRNKENWIEMDAPKGQKIHTLYLIWKSETSPVSLEVWEKGDWSQVRLVNDGGYLHEVVRLAGGAERVRLRSTSKVGAIPVLELRAFSEGELPGDVQEWQESCTEADILVLVAHPDDEYLFLGGTIPWYAMEEHRHVAVAYMTVKEDLRYHELLNGLWTAGVREYPYMLGFYDKLSYELKYIYKYWGEDQALDKVARLIETTRPQVVITQGLLGEYGHAGHQAVADLCVRLIRDGERNMSWQPKKLYLHMNKENPISMDWSRTVTEDPEHRTALEIARDAFHCHASQVGFSQKIHWGPNKGKMFKFEVVEGGYMDNAAFGLVYSAVGPDDALDDFLEHIPQREE